MTVNGTTVDKLEAFIEKLLDKLPDVSAQLAPDPLEALHNTATLTLAKIALRHARLLNDGAAGLGLQVLVLGPTQAGKSSLVNRILGSDCAGVSALAGHTIHLHGFRIEHAPDADTLAPLLAPLERVAASELAPDQLEQYTLEAVPASAERGTENRLAGTTFWDSPDFDSLESASYRDAVLFGMSLADVVILALSKDKYADRTVWTVLELLHGLRKPVLIVLNKLDLADKSTLLASVNQRHQSHFGEAAPPIYAIAFTRGGMQPTHDADLLQSLQPLLTQVERWQRPAQAQALARRFWPRWTAQLRLELAAQRLWQQDVTTAIEQADAAYATRYLHDRTHYDTFNRALVSLLELLEIPGLAKVLGRTRQAVTWPVRQVFRWGKGKVTGEPHARQGHNIEQQILEDIGEELMTGLQAQALDAAETADETRIWWQALYQHLRRERAELLAGYSECARQGQRDFAPRIDAAAQRLHAQLQQTPAVLNTLRAARATTDAAGVALAVKSGGVPTADLVLAPAMLSLTSLLTESALGRYLDKVRSDLQHEQREQRRQRLFEGYMAVRLVALGHQAHGGTTAAISALELAEMERWLQVDNAGLDTPSHANS